MPVAITAHAYKRIKERIKFRQHVCIESWAKALLRAIRSGEGKLVEFTNGRLIYDVWTDTPAYAGTVRMVVDETKTFVVSVVPTISKAEEAKRSKRADAEARGRRTREFYRSLRIEDDDGECEERF
jgi:hypothetical protein